VLEPVVVPVVNSPYPSGHCPSDCRSTHSCTVTLFSSIVCHTHTPRVSRSHIC
jgi:hypothetical protein